MKKELDERRQKEMYVECSRSQLAPQQLRKVVKTRWVIADASTTTAGELRARSRSVVKGYLQQVESPTVDTYAATPSSTSLKTVLLLGILAGCQTTSLDISTALKASSFLREIYVEAATRNGTATHLMWCGASSTP